MTAINTEFGYVAYHMSLVYGLGRTMDEAEADVTRTCAEGRVPRPARLTIMSVDQDEYMKIERTGTL